VPPHTESRIKVLMQMGMSSIKRMDFCLGIR